MQIGRAYPLALALRRAGPLRRLRGWDRLLRLLFPPDRQAPFVVDIPFEGKVYRAHTDNFLDWSAFFYGAYERDALACVRALLRRRPAPVVIDVGANVGHHTLYFAAGSCEVNAFEPIPDLIRLIEEKVALNGLEDSIFIHPVGLGAETGSRPFALPSGSNWGIGTFCTDRGRAGRDVVDLPVVNGDAYLRSRNIGKCDLIKIDVEGFERQVLQGLSETISRNAPILWIEVSRSEPADRVDGAFLERMLPCPYDYLVLQRTSRLFNIFKPKPIPAIPSAGTVDVICVPRDGRPSPASPNSVPL